MNKTDREQVGRVREMVDELWQATPPTAMFRNGNYTFRVRDRVGAIREALDDLLGIEENGEADSEG